LDYEKPVSTGVQAKISIGSFLPFSTVSTHSVISPAPIDAMRKIYSITSLARAHGLRNDEAERQAQHDNSTSRAPSPAVL
jgi:hypothetical protein